nr:HU family DNA-binding protein [Hephaestia mangrovi]
MIDALLTETPGLTKPDGERAVTAFFGTIVERLAAGGRVELRGFGAFSVRDRSPRTGRNPRTGEAVDVKAKRAVHFKPGKVLRERVDQ